MGDKLKPVVPLKSDAFSVIQKYMMDPGAVELTADAERMLKRLMFADTLMRSNRHTSDEVCKELQETFLISEFTALRDIKNAQKLFAQARTINKQYLAHLHLERINKDIEEARDRLFWEENENIPGAKLSRTPDAKELAALAKLHQAYSLTLDIAPDEKGHDTLPPPIFNFTQVVINTGMTAADAMKMADQILDGSVTPGQLPEIPADDVDWEQADYEAEAE